MEVEVRRRPGVERTVMTARVQPFVVLMIAIDDVQGNRESTWTFV
jgi:hypothetical protein